MKKGIIWFDGNQFQAGSEQEFSKAMTNKGVRVMNGFNHITLEEAIVMVENLNRSNVLNQMKKK